MAQVGCGFLRVAYFSFIEAIFPSCGGKFLLEMHLCKAGREREGMWSSPLHSCLA